MNLFEELPLHLSEELVTVLASHSGCRIERIVSQGQKSPDNFWYDQDEHEWVIVIKGEGHLRFENEEPISMKPGDHCLIPAHRRHRVEWTTPHELTIWLAVFFSG